MTANINRVDRICGIIRNVSLLGLTMFWGLLGEFGVYRNPIGFSCAAILFLIFFIPVLISKSNKEGSEEFDPEKFEKTLDEGIKNGSINKDDLKRMTDEIKTKIDKNEKLMRKDRLIIFAWSVVAIITAILAEKNGIMNLQEMICIVLLVWPSYQISKGIKNFIGKTLRKRGFCNGKC